MKRRKKKQTAIAHGGDIRYYFAALLDKPSPPLIPLQILRHSRLCHLVSPSRWFDYSSGVAAFTPRPLARELKEKKSVYFNLSLALNTSSLLSLGLIGSRSALILTQTDLQMALARCCTSPASRPTTLAVRTWRKRLRSRGPRSLVHTGERRQSEQKHSQTSTRNSGRKKKKTDRMTSEVILSGEKNLLFAPFQTSQSDFSTGRSSQSVQGQLPMTVLSWLAAS